MKTFYQACIYIHTIQSRNMENMSKGKVNNTITNDEWMINSGQEESFKCGQLNAHQPYLLFL